MSPTAVAADPRIVLDVALSAEDADRIDETGETMAMSTDRLIAFAADDAARRIDHALEADLIRRISARAAAMPAREHPAIDRRIAFSPDIMARISRACGHLAIAPETFVRAAALVISEELMGRMTAENARDYWARLQDEVEILCSTGRGNDNIGAYADYFADRA